jgi:hypothetical protein
MSVGSSIWNRTRASPVVVDCGASSLIGLEWSGVSPNEIGAVLLTSAYRSGPGTASGGEAKGL